LGTELLCQLIQFGRDEKLQCLIGDILPENQEMQEVYRQLGFRLQQSLDGRLVRAELDL
jgi:RimJ/RimL family protein N-acetyltransferase